MERDGCDAGILGDATGVEVGEVIGVDALAHLHGQRDVACGARRARDDVTEELELPRQRSAAALAGDLGDRASEVQVDVVRAVLLDEDADRTLDRGRIDSVELDRPRGLGFVVRDEAHGRGVALHQCTGGDHLADVQPGAVLAAEPPERRVRDARHRREDDGGVERDGADAEGPLGGKGDGHVVHSPRGIQAFAESDGLAWGYDTSHAHRPARDPVRNG